MAINVLIADRERAFVDVLAARLDDEDDIEVMGAVQVQVPGSSLLAGKSAEVMVLDGDLLDDAANRLCEKLSGGSEPTRVIILSFSSEPERIVNPDLSSGLMAGAGRRADRFPGSDFSVGV
jgi:DNA-binding NarL/FixJ family response regulator